MQMPNNCVFHDNEYEGISGAYESTIHLHGEATVIHSNGENGIAAHDSSKVIIHLPSNHNTTYNNEGVSLANMNHMGASGTVR